PPFSTLFPYTTLFRSVVCRAAPGACQLPRRPGSDKPRADTGRGLGRDIFSRYRWSDLRGRRVKLVRGGAASRGIRNRSDALLFLDRKSTRLNSSHVAI